ncbi:MAG: hypothetical protein RML95_06095 [Anaerolineae bacterium]|nr:hypothetical protein [Anaerolineae bacterium]MDW8298890.1 hypothetical protein [Anaerolineae bacterium]
MVYGTRSHTLRNPQAVAWAIMLTSFVIFCLLMALGTAGTYWFLFESRVEMTVRLTVSKGRVDLILPDGSPASAARQEFPEANSVIQVDSVSQGYLTFEDNYSKQLIATVFLMQGSSLAIERAARPRFEWSAAPYTIRLRNAIGRFWVDLPSGVARERVLEIESEAGVARFSQSGNFRLYSSSQQIDLHVDNGGAELRAPSGETRAVKASEIGTLLREPFSSGTFIVRATPFEQLNADFGKHDDIDTNPALPFGWACTSRANRLNEPQGSFSRMLFEQQVVLNMQRLGQGLDHAETSCQYTFSEDDGILLSIPRRSLSAYDSLYIRARVRIRSQDVTTCGIQGSECPVMIQLDYLGENNAPERPQVWRHGFYTLRPPTDENPTICDTCLQEHEKINADTWYIYDSGDLFKLLPGARKPESILRLRVYASGHAYESIIANLQVIGGRKAQ